MRRFTQCRFFELPSTLGSSPDASGVTGKSGQCLGYFPASQRHAWKTVGLLSREKGFVAAALLLVLSLSMRMSFAQVDYTWTGSVNNQWTNAGNWSGNTLPAFDLTTGLIFNATGTNRYNNTTGQTINRLTFNGGGYTIGGNDLNFVANGGQNPSITQNATDTVTSLRAEVYAADQRLDIKGTGTANLVLYGGLTADTVIKDGSFNAYLFGGATYPYEYDIATSLTVNAGTLTAGFNAALNVNGDGIYLGVSTGETGNLTVTGSGAAVSVPNGAISIGNAGTGTLNVSAGGLLSTLGIDIGSTNTSSTSSLNVDGSGTVVQTLALNVGENGGNGYVNITNGGVIKDNPNNSYYSVLGTSPNGHGYVTVDGTGSLWKTNQSIQIGVLGNGFTGVGTLTVRNGGTVQTAGQLVVHSGSQVVVQNGSTLKGNLYISTGGSLTIDASSSVTGGITNNGTVNGSITASSGMALSGSGNYSGGYTIASGGTLSPGNSPGELTSGNGVWQGGGDLLWEINNAAGAAGTNWDLNTITGTLNLTATSANPFTVTLSSLTASNAAGSLTNWNSDQDGVWDIVRTSSGILNFDAADFVVDASQFTNYNALAGGRLFHIAQNGNNLALVYTASNSTPAGVAAPEPSALTFLIFASSALPLWGIFVRTKPLPKCPGPVPRSGNIVP